MSSFSGATDVWFSLSGTTYQNNSCVTLEDIDENDNALNCKISRTDCCINNTGTYRGNWFFPNGSRVLSGDKLWNFYRTRGEMVVHMKRRRGGEEGIYHCEIPDSTNVKQTIYIGVYTASSGE